MPILPELLDSQMRRRCRRIAHHLKPVVLIGERGLTDAVIEETNRALDDHELIKIRIADEREEREQISADLVARCNAQVVQKIGKTLVLLRKNPEPNTQLSNLHRYPS